MTATLIAVLLLSSTAAEAFRCGRKIVRENMHEVQIRKICGKPAIERQLGYVLRSEYIPVRRGTSPGITVEHFPGYGTYTREVALTEYVYNFGPRKFMRRLLFEGGVLMSIETIGYGYREEK
jgi:hypothetical protein